MSKRTQVALFATSLLLTGVITTPTILGQSPSVVVHADTSEADALISRIDNLPPVEDLNETHAEEIKALMSVYANLEMADRIAITNYETLQEDFDEMVKKGLLTNEDNTMLQEQELQKKKQADRDLSENAVSQAKEYTFKSDGKSGKTVIIRYTTDADGDGQGDAPNRIVLTGPDGTTYPVSNTSISMSDGDKLKVDLTWTDLYLQLDFSTYEQGNWTIETSQAVTFSSRQFTGVASELDAKDEDKETTTKEENKPKKKRSKLVPLFFLTSIIVGVGFAIKKFVSVMRAPVAPTVKEDQLPKDNEPRRMSDEEQLALMKEEYRRQQQDTGELSHLDDVAPTPQRDMTFEPEVIPRRKAYTYDDDEPDIATSKPQSAMSEFSMEEEGDTGILSQDDNPHKQEQKPVDETQSTMDSFNV